MEIIEAIILGIIQGLTEWLPLSSEGMTSLIMINFFGFSLKNAIYYAIWLHTGTLLSAMIYFRKDLFNILRNIPNCFKKQDESIKICRLTKFIMASTTLTALIGIPIMMLGLDKLNLPGKVATLIIGIFLIITGLLQLIRAKGAILSREMRLTDAVPVGFLQGFSILPGISRSGITVSSLLLMGYDAKKAIRISFLMSIPVILIAEIGITLLNKITFDINSIIAIVTSLFFGLITIRLLITTASRINFGYFCIFIGILSSFAFLV